jgi:hypothetical protein
MMVLGTFTQLLKKKRPKLVQQKVFAHETTYLWKCSLLSHGFARRLWKPVAEKFALLAVTVGGGHYLDLYSKRWSPKPQLETGVTKTTPAMELATA